MKPTFEYDSQKSARNKAKHGIDFNDAQSLWLNRVVQIKAEVVDGEMRYANFGKIGNSYWTAIIAIVGPCAGLSRSILQVPARLNSMSDPKNAKSNRPVPISTEAFDRKVETGESIDEHLDWENAETIMPGELSRREEIVLLKEKVWSMQNAINDLLAQVERFEEQEAVK